MRLKPSLTATDTATMMAACKSAAAARALRVSIAIVDEGGYLLEFHRMDGAGPNTPESALLKARTSAYMRRPTKDIEQMAASRPSVMALPNIVPMEGAVPLFHDGDCVGAIGVSGARAEEDAAIGLAGAACLGAG